MKAAKGGKQMAEGKGSPGREPLQLVRTAQKGAYVGKYEVLSGEASCKRRLSSL